MAVCAVLALLWWVPGAAAQSETADAPSAEARWQAQHSPQGALWRAAAVPGWGQLYNRQYLKIPVVYAGIGGVTALALLLNREYLIFRHAALYAEYRDAETRPDVYSPDYEDAFRQAFARVGAPLPDPNEPIQEYAAPFRQRRDYFRRNRDLSYFGIGLVYGLSILDAYVSAHLMDFDVGEDLTFSVFPHPAGITATTRLTLE